MESTVSRKWYDETYGSSTIKGLSFPNGRRWTRLNVTIRGIGEMQNVRLVVDFDGIEKHHFHETIKKGVEKKVTVSANGNYAVSITGMISAVPFPTPLFHFPAMVEILVEGTFVEIDQVDWQPGLVLVRRGKLFLEDGGKPMPEGEITGHAVIVAEDTNYIIEATADKPFDRGIVRKVDRQAWVNEQEEVYVVWAYRGGTFAPHKAGLDAARFAEKQLDLPYNWEYYNRFLFNKYYCSQLCWRAWEQAGYRLDWDTIGPGDKKSKDYVTPNDLTECHMDACNLVIIRNGSRVSLADTSEGEESNA